MVRVRTGRSRVRRTASALATAVGAVVCLHAAPAGAQAARPVTFADWTVGNNQLATGTLGETPVSVAGSVSATQAGGTTVDESSTRFAGPAFTPPLAQSDALGLIAPGSSTIDLGRPTLNPVFHLASLASTLTFPAGTSITKVSGDGGFTVSGNTVSGTVLSPTAPVNVGPDSNGTIRLNGTFTTLAVSGAPTYGGGGTIDGIFLQVGASPPDAAIGDIDPDFNGGRPLLITPPSGQNVTFSSVLVDGLGGMAAAGSWIRSGGTTGVLARLGVDGTFDTSFGGGYVEKQYDVAGTPVTQGQGVLTDPDGRLGAAWHISSRPDLVVGRYTASGAEDGGYGNGTGNFANLASVDIAPDRLGSQVRLLRAFATGDGSTVLIGDSHYPSAPVGQARVVKLTPQGDLDAGYGSGGRASLDNQSTFDGIAYPDGRVLVIGAAGGSGDGTVTRLTADGHLDTSFGGGDGIAPAPLGTGTGSAPAAIAPDGSIYLAGDASITKLSASGTPDPVFGTRTVPTAALGLPGSAAITSRTDALSVQGDGRLVVAGHYQRTGAPIVMGISRFLADGTVDTSLGGDGTVTKVIGPNAMTIPTALAQTRSGKLVVAGFDAGRTGGNEAFVARYVLRAPSDIKPPELIRAPTLTGTPSPHSTLTCGPAQWANAPTSTDVVWERAPRATASAADPAWGVIAATTGITYTVTDEDVGSRVRCREVASNGDGEGGPAPSISKRVDSGPPANLQPPSQAGLPIVGQTLTCTPGQWSGGPDLSVRWRRGDALIEGASNAQYVVREEDRRSIVSCEVTAANDVGSAEPRRSNGQLAVGAVPRSLTAPVTSSATVGSKATDVRLSCRPGTWDEDYHDYDFRWERAGAEIAGATGATYDATVDDLGTLVACVVHATNPVGRSEAAKSDPVLVPLPAGGEPGAVYQAGGFNRLDPLNLLAVSKPYLDAIKDLVVARRTAGVQATKADCANGPNADAPLPDASKAQANITQPSYYGGRSLCGILLHAAGFQITARATGTYWRPFICRLPGEDLPGVAACPRLGVRVPALNGATPPAALSTLEQDQLQRVRPVRVLWDFNRDGQTDAQCDPGAPILRSLYSRGIYTVRAVIVSAESQATGAYSVTDYPLRFFPASDAQQGSLRGGQPFACKTSLEPPPEPSQACVTEVAIGRTHVEGNLCPISARRIPPAELDGLPLNVQKLLENQALNGPLRAAPDVAPPDPGARPALGALRAAPGSVAYDTTAQISAISTLDGAKAAAIPKAWESKLKDVPSFDLPSAQYAMDQIYIAKGRATVNGVQLDPVAGASTVLVPSDAGAAVQGIKAMTISSTNVAQSLGGIPLSTAGKLSTDLRDKVGGEAQKLASANFDALAAALKDKLDLGPFKLAGSVDVKLADDGSAFLDAQAELPALLSGPGARPIRTGVQIRATRAGKVTLEGVHLSAGLAYLGGVKIRNLAMDYDGSGLAISGQLLFPPVNEGISINRFRIDDRGRFRELDVDYLAGAGQGISVGPGLFLTKLGGGLSLGPDEVRGRATISAGPSTGGGCPTAGVDAGFVVHFAPAPFFVDATGTVQLVCIPIGDTHFYADSTGLVDLSSNVHLDLGLLYFSANVHGTLQLPRWQVDARGSGGIRHVLSGEVKALISNYGVAGCGRVEIFPETPITDSVTIAGGAGVRFAGGRPPFSYPELINNLRVFGGCSLTSWSPFGRDARAAQAGAAATFRLPAKTAKVVALELVGAGGAPKVRLRTPAGKVLDATGLGAELTRSADLSGLLDEGNSRTILFVRGQPGTWSVDPAQGSPRLVQVRHASVLPEPRVRATVGGAGAARTLRYDVARLPGQEVRFVERSRQGQRVIRVVKTGGKGTASFVTSEGRGTARTVVAEVLQEGLPRATVTVARFRAPSPAAGAARRVRVRRAGRSGVVTWSAAPYATAYEVSVLTGAGRRLLLAPDGKRRSVRFGGLARGEGAEVRVVALTAAGRRGPAVTARLSGALRYVSLKPKVRPQLHRRGTKARSRTA